nr:alpha/beta fold hydrolase [Kineosphaera limosa]
MELSDGTLHDPIALPAPVASGLSLSADGRALAVTVEGPGRRRGVALTSLAAWGPGGSPVSDSARWTLVDPVPADPQAVQPALERFRAHDGLELSGWLYRSPSAPPGPGRVLVYFHGGPEGQSRPEFSDVFGPLLERGISVFAPNVRGSSGFGRAYWHADDHERRWDGIRDAVTCADMLIERGIAGPGQLAVAGRSYGGYLTNAVLAFHPGHFVCGVAICGMSEFAAFFRETEPWIGRASYSKYGHPEEDADLLAELSPIHRAAEVCVPMLFIHGGNDTNVPVGESLRMAAALRAAGSAAETLVVPGEGHDFTRPANRALLARRLADFVHAHLP